MSDHVLTVLRVKPIEIVNQVHDTGKEACHVPCRTRDSITGGIDAATQAVAGFLARHSCTKHVGIGKNGKGAGRESYTIRNARRFIVQAHKPLLT